MPVDIEVMPPVLNEATASQRPLKNARTGAMPMKRHAAVVRIVPMTMVAIENRTMKRAVCIMLGITCSLRPSEEYKDESTARPNKPSDKR